MNSYGQIMSLKYHPYRDGQQGFSAAGIVTAHVLTYHSIYHF